jgi:hypothetical protein
MSYEVPERYELEIKDLAAAQQISLVEALDLVLQAGLRQVGRVSGDLGPQTRTVPALDDIFAKGRNCPSAFKTREEIDAYVDGLRDEW